MCATWFAFGFAHAAWITREFSTIEKDMRGISIEMRGPFALFVGGGQEYHGPTAKRDQAVVKLVASHLYNLVGTSVQVITGGMPGIPEDFAKEWHALGGSVLCVVSSEQEEAFKHRNTGFAHQVAGESQEKRRIAVTKWPNLACALFVQGGRYSTHEMQLIEDRGLPIVTFWGSGGAAGGQIPYHNPITSELYVYENKPEAHPLICSTDPDADPEQIATAIALQLSHHLIKKLGDF